MANGNVVYEMATERILVELEKGVIPWRKPWAASGGAYNYKTGRKYMMINQMLLKHQDGYVTFNQCKKLGGKVKKGSKAEVVFEWFVKSVPAKGKDGGEILDENGKPVSKKIVRLTYDRVFWIGDCEDLPEKEMDDQKTDLVQIKDCEDVIKDYVKRSGIGFQNDRPSDRAYYSPASDKVVVPMLDQYSEGTEYYSTIFHELTHSTGHKSRLNRFSDEKAAAFGSEVYSKEELVAEIGAATLMHATGQEIQGTFKNSVAYIQSWMKALKNDKKMVVQASARAEKAVNLILGSP